MARIEVENIRELDGRGSLKAFVDIRIGGTLFRSWRIVQQTGQKPWVSPPVERWSGKDGKTRYTRLVEFPADFQKAVESAILGAWESRRSW